MRVRVMKACIAHSNPARRLALGRAGHEMTHLLTRTRFLLTQVDVINSLLLLTAKPVIYLVNLSPKDYARKKNKWLPKIKEWIDQNNPGDMLIPFSAAMEEEVLAAGEENTAETLKQYGDNVTSALGKITKSGYDGLDLIRYFTCGPDEVRAWSIRRGVKAPQAAGVIHSDLCVRC